MNTTKRNAPKQQPQTGERPTYRAWLVTDVPNGEPLWTELAGLWNTKTGNGFSGTLKAPVVLLGGLPTRLVILPAKARQDGDAE